jgi:hypothetical protein
VHDGVSLHVFLPALLRAVISVVAEFMDVSLHVFLHAVLRDAISVVAEFMV